MITGYIIYSIVNIVQVLAINQDSLGKQGKLTGIVGTNNTVEVYMRLLDDDQKAVAILNRGSSPVTKLFITWRLMGLQNNTIPKKIRDVWARDFITPEDGGLSLDIDVQATQLLRLSF